MDFCELDELKRKLDSFRPLPQGVLENIREKTILEWTYNSNAIEGNTLTLKETKVVLEGITVGGKLLKEHLEAINHKEAILFVEEIVQDNAELSEYAIKSIHKLILKNIDDENAGVYRKCNVTISGARHTPPDYVFLQDKMANFISDYSDMRKHSHPLEQAVYAHSEFVKIHPFIDGNGRTARLIMNLEFMKSGFPPVILPISKRLDYYEALDAAHCENNLEPFLYLINGLAKESFCQYFNALGDYAK